MDLLGFGKSPKPQDVEYSGSLWKDQVVAYVQEKIKKPTIIVGNSLGGYAALAAGAELNDLNAGVILLNAAGYFSEEKTIKKNMLQTSIETVAGIFLKNIVLQRLIFENMRNPKKRSLYKKFTPKNTKEIILDAGHCPHDEIPELVNQHILDWVDSL